MKRIPAVMLGLSFQPSVGHACSVCFGDPNSNMARSIWPGVYFLLGLVGLVLFSVAYLGWAWIRRESRGVSS